MVNLKVISSVDLMDLQWDYMWEIWKVIHLDLLMV